MDLNAAGSGGTTDRRYYYAPQEVAPEVEEPVAPESPSLSWWDKLKALKGTVDGKVQEFIYPKGYQGVRDVARGMGANMRYYQSLDEELSKPGGATLEDQNRVYGEYRKNLYGPGMIGE